MALLSALLLPVAPVRADGVFNLLVENDVWTGTDRHYTSGVMLNYVSEIDKGPQKLKELGLIFPGITDTDKIHLGLSLGHEIYTPNDILATELLEDERPYAAHAYLAAGFTLEVEDVSIETWRISLGLIGPGAGGEHIQNTLHDAIGVEPAMGWRYQLKNEAVVSFAYERKWLDLEIEEEFMGLQFDLIPHVSAAVGNLGVHMSLGGMARIGRGLDHDYGPPRIRPSLPVSQFYNRGEGASWYLYAGVDARWVGRSIFLDGNNFRDSHEVSREPWVGDMQAGVVVNTRHFRLAYTYVIRSKEFSTQGERDIYGSLSLSTHF
ncbi:MAG: lipid A deacylase LpxR family protein [Pseudomonadota bacterium]